jgi:hypothetical protein
MAMFEMQTHPKPQAFEFTSGVVGSVVLCVVLLASLVVADRIFWSDPWAAQTQYYDQHRWNTNG